MMFKTFELRELFQLTPGAFHATWELDSGNVPLVSCGWENNGVIGYYDIPSSDTHERALSVAFNGAPLTTHFHPYRFGAKDDVAILRPIEPLADSILIYVAAVLNAKVWRYSYGRKCYREKLARVDLQLPVKGPARAPDAALADRLVAKAFNRVQADAAASVNALFNPGGHREASVENAG